MVWETFLRSKNIRFYTLLGESKTVRDACRASGVTFQHGARLLKSWRDGGLISRRPTLHGERYVYTVKGLEVCMAYQDLLQALPELLRGA